MAGRSGDRGKAQRGAIERCVGVDHAGTAPGAAILSGHPRSRPAGEMADGQEPKDVYKDRRQARSVKNGAGEGSCPLLYRSGFGRDDKIITAWMFPGSKGRLPQFFSEKQRKGRIMCGLSKN